MKAIVRNLSPVIIGLMLVFFSSSAYACAKTGQKPPPGLWGGTPDTITICTPGISECFQPNWVNPPREANVTFIWNWGDGSPIETVPPAGLVIPGRCHTYTAAGTYPLVLTKTNPNGTVVDTIYLNVYEPPIAGFTMITDSICWGGTPIDFTDVSSPGSGNPINSWSWNFGDQGVFLGGTDTIPSPSHTYVQPGNYEVSLTVKNTDGCASTYKDSVKIVQDTSVIDFSYSSGCPCNNIQFTSIGSAISWNWDFGDGTTSTSPNPTHIYSTPASYNVTLTGINSGGCIDKEVQVIPVCPNDTPPPSKSNNRWYFYTNAGVDFSSGSPVAITNGMMAGGIEGGATISDPVTGNLLFYTNGITVWDATHTVMTNGSGLSGGVSTEQAALIIPFPGNISKYYIFTGAGSTDSRNEIFYSVVDMSLNGGLGEVVLTQKNIFLTYTSVSLTGGNEALTGTTKKEASCNSSAQYWVVISPNGSCDTYLSFLIDSSGVSSTPITSTISSSSVPGGYTCDVAGYTAMSPNGGKIARATRGYGTDYGGVLLFDFNKNTGVVSNPIVLKGPINEIYSVVFSPDNRLLYAVNQSPPNYRLYQYDITAANPQSTLNSIYSTSTSTALMSMWVGPDNKIYIAGWAATSIAVVNNPNVYGAGCSFTLAGVSLAGKSCLAGLQNIVPLKIPIIDTSFAAFSVDTSSCLDVSFTNQVIQPYTDICRWLYNNDTLIYTWDFGDGSSQVVTSDTTQITHTYSIGGTYNVSLTVDRPYMCTTNTLIQTINVDILPTASILGTTTICSGNSTTLTASGGGTYLWNTTATTTAITVSPISTTTYSVIVSKESCSSSVSQTVTVNPNPTPSITGTTTICYGNSTTLTASGGDTYSWSTGSTITAITVSPTTTTTYTVTASTLGCTGISTVIVNVGAIPDISITPPAELNCSNATVTLTGSSTTSGATYQWTSGSTTAIYIVNSPATYTLTVTDPTNGCATQQTIVVNSNTTIPDISIVAPNQLTCANTSDTLRGSSTTAGVTYQWLFGPADSLYSVSTAATYTLTVTNPVNTCTASQAVTVTQDGSIPNITITPSEITCTNDSVVIQASSSTGGVTYQWTGGPADSVYTVGAAGNYTLTATNTISGCTSVQVVYVNSNTTAPNISIATPSLLTCDTLSTTLIGSSTTAGVTYQWTAGPLTASYLINTAATYTLTVTDPSNGCTSQQTIVVSSNTTPPVVTASSSGNITCSNTSSTLTGVSAGNTMKWNGGTLTNAPNPSTVTAAGTYTVTATDASNGCITTAIVTVAENTGIPNVSIASPNTLTCDTISITLIGSSDTAGVNYQWTGGIGTTTSAYTVSTPSTYTLTVTNSINGCTNTASVTVTENTGSPNVNISIPALLTCDTTSITLIGSSDTAGVTYQWTGGTTTSTYTVTTPSTYTLTVTNPNNGCAAQQTVVVNSNTTPPTVTVNSVSICTGQTATLTASGANTYSWNTGENTMSITVNPTTDSSYTVTGINTANGCTNTATAAVNVVTTPTAIATDVTVCEGETINLTSTGGGTYSWNGPNAFNSTSQNPTITNPTIANSGTYTVTVSNGSCSATAIAMITVNPTPSTNAGNDVNVTIGSSTTLTATGGTTYIWTPTTGLDCDTCASVIATPTATAIYCVQSSIGTCSSSDCVTVIVEAPCPNNKDLAVPNAFSPNADGHNDDFCLQGWNACVETFTILIYDRWGEKVFESEEANFCWDGMYRGKIMDPAVFVYYIKATFTNDEQVVKKGNVSLIR